MDNEKLDNEVTSILQKFNSLNSAYEEGKKAQEELNEFIALLREELKLARDAERSAVTKKNLCQGLINQQQEIISKLLSAKEENEKLKGSMNILEKTLSDIQNNSISERLEKDAEINKIKNEYLQELVKIQEATDEREFKIKADQASRLEELRQIISKKEEMIEQQSNSIISLQAELKDLKEREKTNLDVYKKKLAEQERKYEAELETWKLAELNQITLQQGHFNNTSTHHKPSTMSTENPYQSGSTSKQMNYQYNMSHRNNAVQDLQLQFQSVLHSRNSIPGIVRPTVRQPTNNFQKSVDYLSAHDYYLQNQNLFNESEDRNGMNPSERLITNKNNQNQKPKVLVPKKRKLYKNDQNLL